ncbi:nucleotide-binding domain-containing protein [Serratia marcescens]|uniref:nucleotide-binding domain-containing protein n=1 Tax=Serratia sp. CY56810 TaxID=3383642 RepID=UPI002F32C70F
MNCNDLFYSHESPDNTLHQRTKLSSVILSKGISKKDELIEFLRQELKEAFDCDVGFWLQGSYKSRTLIKPVDKFSSYDIDIGVYLFFDAESEGIKAGDVKETLRDALLSYCKINNEAELQKSKNACEGLKFSTLLTIDTPIYYKTDANIKLATDEGWSDSDPKSIQDWLTGHYSDKQKRALMKRLVRYFKAWINVKWQGTGFKKIPSLAINVLVAQHMRQYEREDDCFIYTALSICEELESVLIVSNPLNGSNLIAMPQDAESFAHQKLDELKEVCLSCIDSNEFERGIHFSNLFQHYFPQVSLDSVQGNTGLPAITNVPEISICRYDKNGNHIETTLEDQLTVNKGDSLTFTICNHESFNIYSCAQWTVRNIGPQANDANDIGHKVIGKPNESHKRDTSYTGAHTMECMITYNGVIVGFKTINVIVRPARTLRRKIFKGWRG